MLINLSNFFRKCFDLFYSVHSSVFRTNFENFHEFLRGHADIFNSNIYATKDSKKGIAVVKGNKDSTMVMMKKSDYLTKLDTMINDGIMKGTYTKGNMLKEISRFQDFL